MRAPGWTSLLVVVSAALAEEPGDSSLAAQFQALEDSVALLQAQVEALEAENAALRGALGAEAPALVTPEGCTLTLQGTDAIFEGCDVHVRSGAGATREVPGSRTGLGNLIVGYDEADGDDQKTGAHNLVVGPYHSYPGYGGLVAGYNNTLSAPYTAIAGGRENAATEWWASVCGGRGNVAAGESAAVSGGWQNHAEGARAWVGGGWQNHAEGTGAAVPAGLNRHGSGFAPGATPHDSSLQCDAPEPADDELPEEPIR